jgi:hypothetical protein
VNIKQIEQHIPILGGLHVVMGVFSLVIGVFIFMLLTSIGLAVANEDPIAPRILITVGTAVGILVLVLSLPGIIAGYGLLKRRTWARPLAIVVGALSLFNIPIGTLIGIYTLIVLAPTEAADYFTSYKPALTG